MDLERLDSVLADAGQEAVEPLEVHASS